MFERYTEHARRTIFFARYEASVYGSPYIETEHLLLGLLREDAFLREHVSADIVHRQIEKRSPPKKSTKTSVDLPLNHEAKRVLAYAAEESERRRHPVINCHHLLLGLLREEKSFAAELLREQKLTREMLDGHLSRNPPRDDRQLTATLIPRAEEEEEPELPLVGPLAQPLAAQVAMSHKHLKALREADGIRKLKRREWSRKQALGHLIDQATAHHQWFARAMVEPSVTAISRLDAAWAAAQNYDFLPWAQLVAVWHQLNQLLVHILTVMPEDRWKAPIRIGLEPPTPLDQVVAAYVERADDVLGEILMRVA